MDFPIVECIKINNIYTTLSFEEKIGPSKRSVVFIILILISHTIEKFHTVKEFSCDTPSSEPCTTVTILFHVNIRISTSITCTDKV